MLVCISAFGLGQTVWAQPALKVIAPESEARAGKAYHLDYEVSWTGEADAYVVDPAEVELVEWGSLEVESLTARSMDQTHAITQRVAVVPREAGEFSVPEIRFAYKSPEDPAEPEAARTPTHPTAPGNSPQLRADPYMLHVQPDRTLSWPPGSLGTLSFIILVLILAIVPAIVYDVWRRSSRRGSAALSLGVDSAGVRAGLRAAKERRLQGDYYGFYTELSRAAELLEAAAPGLAAPLKARGQDVGFRGVRPTEDMMNGDLRDVERALEASLALEAGPSNAIA